ncbi:MAG: CheR family methyltransferase [Pseudomonadota bacterium]
MMVGKTPSFVVGLGASAGGLEALERFFDRAPTDSGGAFIVVMHLSRNFKSMLDELLARHTDMPVIAASDDLRIEANSVYVIQSGTTIEVNQNILKVAARPQHDAGGPATSVDTLFRSIAATWGTQSGAVVLSGSGSDGSAGVVAINEAGGFACAQSPETAKFDSMPISAISTNAVRAVEAPEQLAQTVIEGILLPRLAPTAPTASEHDAALARILKAVVGVSDLDITKYKHSTFERRVRRRMIEAKVDHLSEYADRIEESEAEAHALAESLLISVTSFFRDPHAFAILSERIVPEIIRRAQKEHTPVRVWTPGCATGEEAYSIAMCFADAMRDIPEKIDVQIFATDIKRDDLAFAAKGEYTWERIEPINETTRERYFKTTEGADSWTIDPDIRRMIVFAPHDVLADPPFTRLNLISCRNLLIYLSVEAQQRILGSFAFGLRESGYLFLGSSESVGARRDAFEFVDARCRIFTRTAARIRSTLFTDQPSERSGPSGAMYRQAVRQRESALQPAYAALLNEYAPPSLLVSENRELMHSFGEARSFLRPPEGVAHLDAAEMVDPALKTPLIAGVERVFRDHTPIVFRKLSLHKFPERGAVVDMTVKPLLPETGNSLRHALVVIEEVGVEPETKNSDIIVSGDYLSHERVRELEFELERTREALQSTIEEIEATNEELQSSNEELMSSNEELHSTNEELSSVNEELYSVNAEYHRQNDDLVRLGADFDLLLEATEVGVLFLDSKFRITRYTSLGAELFNLTEADIGRSLSTFRSPFKGFDPVKLLNQSRSSGRVAEAEAYTPEKVSWLVRAVQNQEDQSSILTLINVGRKRESEADIKQKLTSLDAIRRQADAFAVVTDARFQQVYAQSGFFEYFSLPAETAPFPAPLNIFDQQGGEIVRNALVDADRNTVSEATVEMLRGPTLGMRPSRIAVQKISDQSADGDAEALFRIVAVDAARIATKETERLAAIGLSSATLRASGAPILIVDRDSSIIEANPAFVETFGAAPPEATLASTFSSAISEAICSRMDGSLNGEAPKFTLEMSNKRGETVQIDVAIAACDTGDANLFAVSLMRRNAVAAESNAPPIEQLLLRGLRITEDAVLLADVETGTVEFANTSAKERLGIEPARPLPKSAKLSRSTPEWSDSTWREWLNSIETGESQARQDVIVIGDGPNVQTVDIFAAVLTEDGRRKALVRFFDNRDRIRALSDLRERSRQLAISNRDLEQFASVVAHDLRAPLRYINQFSSHLQSELGENLKGPADEYLAIIGDSARTMSKMVEALLDYGRLARSAHDFQPVDVSNCINKAKGLLSEEIRTAGAEINFDHLPHPLGDEDLLTRVFQNLISNAIKYRRADKSPTIEISAREGRDQVEISVTDNGVGIDPSHADKIFRLFQRLHFEDQAPGLGVGLATCRRICEMHGGGIDVDRSYIGGARFKLTLPMPLRHGAIGKIDAAQ